MEELYEEDWTDHNAQKGLNSVNMGKIIKRFLVYKRINAYLCSDI